MHDERDRAVPPLNSTVILARSQELGRREMSPVIQINEKKPTVLPVQSTMFTEFLPGAKVLDKIHVFNSEIIYVYSTSDWEIILDQIACQALTFHGLDTCIL